MFSHFLLVQKTKQNNKKVSKIIEFFFRTKQKQDNTKYLGYFVANFIFFIPQCFIYSHFFIHLYFVHDDGGKQKKEETNVFMSNVTILILI